jgi:anti-anti-sigma factor
MRMLKITSDLSAVPRTVEVVGDLDLASAWELDGALVPLLSEPTDLVLDLSQVPFVDSRGIAVIVDAMVSIDPGKLIIRSAQERVRRALGTAGLDQLCE